MVEVLSEHIPGVASGRVVHGNPSIVSWWDVHSPELHCAWKAAGCCQWLPEPDIITGRTAEGLILQSGILKNPLLPSDSSLNRPLVQSNTGLVISKVLNFKDRAGPQLLTRQKASAICARGRFFANANARFLIAVRI